MDFFNHVQKLYTENDKNLDLDIPLAIFMIKLLSIKVDFSNFRDKNKFNEYMKSHKPLKLRYYLQVTFHEEMTESTEEAIKKREKENKYIDECFGYKRNMAGSEVFNIPSHEKRIELYEKYLKNKYFHKDVQHDISNWIKPDMGNPYTNSNILKIIREINKKYGNPEFIKSGIIKIMNRFSDKESVYKLLHSIRDVYILGLV